MATVRFECSIFGCALGPKRGPRNKKAAKVPKEPDPPVPVQDLVEVSALKPGVLDQAAPVQDAQNLVEASALKPGVLDPPVPVQNVKDVPGGKASNLKLGGTDKSCHLCYKMEEEYIHEAYVLRGLARCASGCVCVCVSVASPIVLFLCVVGGKNCNVVVQQLPSSLR